VSEQGYALRPQEAEPHPATGEDFAGVSSRILISGSSGCLFRGTFRPGGFHAKHIHSASDEFVYVISCGRALKGLGDRVFDMEPGMCFFIPRSVAHWMQNLDENESIEVVGVYPDSPDIDSTGYEYLGRID
jgi:quercetin dioxygenase-like cupin family protein